MSNAEPSVLAGALALRSLLSKPVVVSETKETHEESLGKALVGLTEVASIMALSRSAETHRKRDAAFKLFSGYLSKLAPSMGVTASPEDLLMFGLELSKTRGRTVGANGVVCSPGYLQSIFTSLSHSFKLAGRTGPWDVAHKSGNPCDSMEVQAFLEGYARKLNDEGYEPGSAVPVTQAKLHKLLLFLTRQQNAALQRKDLRVYWLLVRDAAVFSLMWATAFRGVDAGRLMVRDLADSSYQTMTGAALLGLTPVTAPGYVVYVRPHLTKTERTGPTMSVRLVGAGGHEALFCPVTRLAAYVQASRLLGRFVPEYLFVAEGGDGSEPLSGPAINARLHTHLAAAKLDEGETMHGFRRGRLQHEKETGASIPEIAVVGYIKTPEVLDRYLDPFTANVRLDERRKLEKAQEQMLWQAADL